MLFEYAFHSQASTDENSIYDIAMQSISILIKYFADCLERKLEEHAKELYDYLEMHCDFDKNPPMKHIILSLHDLTL